MRVFALTCILLLAPAAAYGDAWVGVYTDDAGEVAAHLEVAGKAGPLSLFGFADANDESAFARANATYPLHAGLGAFAQVDIGAGVDAVGLGGLAYEVARGRFWASLRALGATDRTGRAMLAWNADLGRDFRLRGFFDVSTDGRIYCEPEIAWRVWGPVDLLLEYRHHDGTDSMAFGFALNLE